MVRMEGQARRGQSRSEQKPIEQNNNYTKKEK